MRKRKSFMSDAEVLSHILENCASSDSGCLLWKRSVNERGYGVVGYKNKTAYAHRLAFFISNNLSISKDVCVCHKCDTPSCCNPNHLFSGTRSDNMADSKNKGRHAFGSRNGRSKLDADKVFSIRSMHGSISNYKIAKIFGVSESQIRRVAKRQDWSWA